MLLATQVVAAGAVRPLCPHTRGWKEEVTIDFLSHREGGAVCGECRGQQRDQRCSDVVVSLDFAARGDLRRKLRNVGDRSKKAAIDPVPVQPVEFRRRFAFVAVR